MFRFVVLGSGASLPTLQRRSAAAVAQYEGDLFLLDCGEGTQLQWRKAALKFGRLRAVFISHLHGDHLNGLVGFLQTLSLGDRQAPLSLFGPPGLLRYWNAIRRAQRVRLGYRLDVQESEGGALGQWGECRIEAQPLDHGVPTLGFALVEGDRAGRFDVEAAARLGLNPGPDFGRLQRGEAVRTADGATIEPSDVLGPPRAGRRLAYCVDTRPCKAAIDLARGASLMVCDSTFGEELANEAAARGHSTAAQAARMAADAGAERLLLTHISARYHDIRPLLAEARKVFENSEVASDLMEVVL